MLNEKEKAKIRAEEIYRQEVRKEIVLKDGNKWLTFLSSPLGIWILSTIVIGLISVGYKSWQESLQSQKTNQERISVVIDEGNFRVRQVDSAINKALVLYGKIQANINTNGKILGSDFRDFIEAAKIITVSIDLGGIIYIPQEKETNTLIGNSGYSVMHLAYKRSYKRSLFSSDSLLDLATQITRYSKENRKLLNTLETNMDSIEKIFRFEFHDILKDWRMRHQASGKYKTIYKKAYYVYNVEMSDCGNEVEIIGKWIMLVKSKWDKIKSNKLIQKMI